MPVELTVKDVFASGYGESLFSAFVHAPRLPKPFNAHEVLRCGCEAGARHGHSARPVRRFAVPEIASASNEPLTGSPGLL